MNRTRWLMRWIKAGLISFLLGFFRIGFIDVVLSRAMLQGFISAVAVLILLFVLTLPLCTRYLISFSKGTINSNVRPHRSRAPARPKFHSREIPLPSREYLQYGENDYIAELWFSAGVDLRKITEGVLQEVVVYIPATRGACCGYHFYPYVPSVLLF